MGKLVGTEDRDAGDSAGRLLTFLLIAAGLAVMAWLLFSRPEPRPGPDQPPPVPTGQVTMTCTCRPAQ